MKISKELHSKLQALGLGCGDGGCVWGYPGGMHTNGGCKCIRPGLSRSDIARIQQGIRVLLQEINKLKEPKTPTIEMI